MSPLRALVVVVLGSVLGIGAFLLFVGSGEHSPVAEAAPLPSLPPAPTAPPSTRPLTSTTSTPVTTTESTEPARAGW